MTLDRIFNEYAYGDGPRAGCWWDETCELPTVPNLEGDLDVDVAVIGGGFSGICAALRLAEQGTRVAVLEANDFGWGASGRNGGFCCLGGGIAEDKDLDALHGREARLAFRRAEKQAVEKVAVFVRKKSLDVDQHSQGETKLAHRPKDVVRLLRSAKSIVENYNVEPEFIEHADLMRFGMGGGPFFGAMTIPIGFGLNPRKYLSGLMSEALGLGALLFSQSLVLSLTRVGPKHFVSTSNGIVSANQVIVATNGYSSENVPPWIAGRFMPGQSTVLVTRALTKEELEAQGWTTDQMSYDSRNLLHYFRLLPDRRFLFGMRGGLMTGPYAEATARAKTRAHFEKMFPNWSKVPSFHMWSGMVSLARNRLPFVGPIPELPGVWAAMCYHGNGVAMGSFAGTMVADLALGSSDADYPKLLQNPLKRFPLGRARRLIMPPLYAALKIKDCL